ncbi:MAG: acetate--CoA ligase, partial [Pseudomonadota bacterium]
MTEAARDALYPVPAAWAARAHVDADRYQAMYAEALADPDGFWRREAQIIDWMTPFTTVSNSSFNEADFGISWFADGALNVSANCLDRHLATRGDTAAIIWEGDDPADARTITYRELHAEVCRFANVLKAQGVQKGDRVTLYLPMIPEAAMAMLACTRIGAIHSIVFGGFSPDSLANRIQDCDSRLVITADEGLRGGKPIPLKANVDAALASCPSVETVIVVRRTGGAIAMQPGRDLWYEAARDAASPDCPPAAMGAEDPLFILYTSGSTGKPKGVLHTTGGYLVWVAMTFRHVFDYRPGEIFWCTADVGWVTGHSYVVYGPLANGATTLMFEGVPNYPDVSRFWQVCDRWGVNIFYTAPTALRALMRDGDAPVKATSRASIRLLGSVAEPGLSAVAPGNGLISAPPVSVCHQVSTMGQRLSPTT